MLRVSPPPRRGWRPKSVLRSREWTNDFAEMDADAALIHVSNHSYGLIAGFVVYPAAAFGFSTPTGLGEPVPWWEDRFQYSTESTAFGKYDDSARELDQVLFDNADLLSVWSGRKRPQRCLLQCFGERNLCHLVFG